ncbi:MAG TPA: hypothetical protein VJL62_02365 [Thermodesulfobacteriota bacterium]|nr:hypothetical protein [Thermodesulfobacteriota bacterium]
MKPRFRLHLEMMVKNFYFFTVFAMLIGGITYLAVRDIGSEISSIKEGALPLLISSQEMQLSLEEMAIEAEGFLKSSAPEEKAAYLEKIEKNKTAFKAGLGKAMGNAAGEEGALLRELETRSKSLFELLDEADIDSEDVSKKFSEVRSPLNRFREGSLQSTEDRFKSSESLTDKAEMIVLILTFVAIAGLILVGLTLSKAVGAPVSRETGRLMRNSKDIEVVFNDISYGTRKQTDVVQAATSELEDMIINIIQGNISLNVDKQAEIARAFSEFLKHFVERTTVEIAMGMMSVSQQSKDARKGIEEFVKEVVTVETNIRAQETAISSMVDALKSIVETNKIVKEKARSSTDATDIATAQAYSGQEKIGIISQQLQDIRSASVGVKDITDSLAKITESIKILALNMSLKVEDIKDDTGKTYGFEAMSAKVEKLAEDVEGLLENSRNMLIPTIQGIEKVSLDASQARDLIAQVARSIRIADEHSKAIAAQIDTQAADIDKVEAEAENLRAAAHKTTMAVEAQGALTRDVDDLLKDSEILIESVTSQTQEASEAARKVNEMMGQLKQTVASIEEGTGRLIEKSSKVSDMFDSIRDLAIKNMSGAERLEEVTASVKEVSNRLLKVFKGEGA